MKIRLTRPAVRDLAEIGRYTRDRWGEKQARRYRAAISARLRWLCQNKSLWHARPELHEGICTYPEHSHVIVFKEYEDGIEILRILHERMDPARRLRED